MRRTRRVVVVGGGILGVSGAFHLARAGCSVLLVTEAALHSQASGRSLSWLNSAGARRESYHRLRMVGIDRYRTLAAQLPGVDWLRFDGGLSWAGEDQAGQQRADHEHEVALGYDSRLLSPDEVARLAPGVDPAAVPAAGALWRAGEGWVDLPSLVRHLARGLVAFGGSVVTDVGPATVMLTGSAVTGVRAERGGPYEADAVLLATGAGVPAAAAELGVPIPDATPLAHSVLTAPAPHRLTAVLNTPRVSLRPAPGGALAVDADWTSADIVTGPDGSHAVPAATTAALLAEASRVLAGHPELRAAAVGVGPKPIPPTVNRSSAAWARSTASTSPSATAAPRSDSSPASCWPATSSTASRTRCWPTSRLSASPRPDAAAPEERWRDARTGGSAAELAQHHRELRE